MNQDVNNKDTSITNQLNIGSNNAPITISKKSRFSKRLEKLSQEVAANERYEGIIDALNFYLTKLDGIDMPTKLKDGGFSEREIFKASIIKERYWKKLEKNKYFEAAQLIDSDLFAKIILDFEANVTPLINLKKNKDEICKAVAENVINPILQFLNAEGENDDFLNYNADDIYGMIYFLTGKCHINWKNYDNI